MARPPVEPHILVVLGATGDLMQRKMLPALFHLNSLETLEKFPAGSLILGVARHPLDDAKFRETAVASLVEAKAGSEADVRAFCERSLVYQHLDESSGTGYPQLGQRLEQLERERGLPGNRIFYLALPLEAFPPTLQGLGAAGLNKSAGWTRVVIEKPFGRDLASATALNALAHQFFEEKQIYRIDHYLGKETVQNLLVFRFANVFFESLWNRDRVDHVEITVAESLGVEGRAGYYEGSGALRDMLQNHVTQLLTLVAMEPPATADQDAIRSEKVKVLHSAVRISPGDVVRGQYVTGKVGDQTLVGYRQEPGVPADSETETYIALRLKIANWRWEDVPFFLRTGKRLPAKSSRIVVTFKAPPVAFFETAEAYEASPDRITIMIQPQEGFELAFEIKIPGREVRVQTHRMRFHYSDVFGELPDGYETLLMDVMRGDASLFVRDDEIEESWRLYAPIIEHPPAIVFYPAGSEGPVEAQKLVQEWGHRWDSD